MYCGGSPPGLTHCPACKCPFGAHAEWCKYYDAATKRLNAKEPRK